MKKTIALVLCLVIATTCIFANGAQEQAGSGVKEISIFHFKSLWLEPWEELMALYEKETGIKVVSDITGGDSDYPTMLKTKISANMVPDMFMIHGFSEYEIFKDYIEPQNDAGWLENASEIAKAGSKVGDTVIGMPMTVESFGIIYNKDLFAKAGIEKEPATFEELVDAVNKLEAIGVTPFATGFATGWVLGQHFMNVPMSKRSDMQTYISNLNEGAVKLNEDSQMKEAKNLLDLVINHCTPNPLAEDHQQEVTNFATGKAAMMLQGNWKENSVLTINPDMNMGLMAIPLGPNDPYEANILSGIPFYISINSKASPEVKQACKDFLTWLVTNKTAQSYIVEKFQGVPAYTNFDTSSMSPLAKDCVRFGAEGKATMWSFSLWPAGTTGDFAIEAQAYISGKLSYQEMLDRMQAIYTRNANN